MATATPTFSPAVFSHCSSSLTSPRSALRAAAASVPRRPLCFLTLGVSALVFTHTVSRRVSTSSPSWTFLPALIRKGAAAAAPSSGEPFPKATLRTTSAAMANVSLGNPAARTITIPPTKEHKATVVFLHGLGDTGEGWADIPGMLQLPNVKWVLPSAPIRPVSVNGGFPCPAWYDIFGLSADSQEDKDGIDKAARYIAGILAEEKAAAPEGTRFIVGGFSMGGALALHLTARKFAGTFLDGSDSSGVPLDGSVCMSGWLPLYSTLKGKALQPSAASHPLLMCHGAADPLVQFSLGKLSADELRVLGFGGLQFKAYQGLAHSASPEELQDVRSWLSSVCS